MCPFGNDAEAALHPFAVRVWRFTDAAESVFPDVSVLYLLFALFGRYLMCLFFFECLQCLFGLFRIGNGRFLLDRTHVNGFMCLFIRLHAVSAAEFFIAAGIGFSALDAGSDTVFLYSQFFFVFLLAGF